MTNIGRFSEIGSDPIKILLKIWRRLEQMKLFEEDLGISTEEEESIAVFSEP